MDENQKDDTTEGLKVDFSKTVGECLPHDGSMPEPMPKDSYLKGKVERKGFFGAEEGNPVIPDDAWKHRATDMKCASCMYYVRKQATATSVNKIQRQIGRCRKSAPTMKGFPAVFPHDWCGDHKLDEDKI